MEGRRSSKRLSNLKQNTNNSTILLDTSNETDVIGTSFSDERFKFLKTPRSDFKKLYSCESKNDLISVKDVAVQHKQGAAEDDDDFIKKKSPPLRNSSLRYTLRRSIYSNSVKSPHSSCSIGLNKTPQSPHPIVNQLITSLKSPELPYLTKSKLSNIEKWLENSTPTVSTPPFANLNVTPLRVRANPVAKTTNRKKKRCNSGTSVDSDVEKLLVAVYGDDWREQNVIKKSRTEPKKRPNMNTEPAVARPVTARKARRKILRLDNTPRKGESEEGSEPPSNKRKAKVLKTPVTGQKKLRAATAKTPKRTFLASLSVSTPTSYCHPEAQDFKINFRIKKEDLCKRLFKLYNSEIFDNALPEDMDFSWNVKLRGTAGFCYNRRITKSTGEVLRRSRIELSTKIVDRADRLRDTLIHELCHAACWIVDGKLDGHGVAWLRWADRAMERFPELPVIRRCHNYDVVAKFTYRCTGCGYSINRHSKSIDVDRKRCGYCYGVLELLVNKKRKGKTEEPEFDTTRTQRTPNKFALFVKNNYQIVKGAMPGAKHGDVMKAISQQYAASKVAGNDK